jgi:hypothetical protein
MAVRASRSGHTPAQAATNAGLSCRETREKRSLERKRERHENGQAKRDSSSGAGNTQRSTRAVSSLAQRFQSTGDDAPPPGDANVSGMAAILPCQFHEKMNKWLLTTNKISSFITKEASTPFLAFVANLARMTWRCHQSAISANVDVAGMAAILPAPTMVRC